MHVACVVYVAECMCGATLSLETVASACVAYVAECMWGATQSLETVHLACHTEL